jgi:hypothetical protein
MGRHRRRRGGGNARQPRHGATAPPGPIFDEIVANRPRLRERQSAAYDFVKRRMLAAFDRSLDRAAIIDDRDTKPQAGAALWCDVWYVCLNILPRDSGASNSLCGLLLFFTLRFIGSSAFGDINDNNTAGGEERNA